MSAIITLLLIFAIVLLVTLFNRLGTVEKSLTENNKALAALRARLKKLEEAPADEHPAPPPIPQLEPEPVAEDDPIAELPPPVPQRKITPPVLSTSAQPLAPPPVQKPAREPISIEQFVGVKLFAWLGGLALFFGIVFFVKYAFDHNLIPPALRITIGYISGAALLVGGLWTNRKKNFIVLAHTLCATGILMLYGVTFASHAVYQFPLFATGPAFGIMSVITVVAFVCAVRMRALVVAGLGLLGGFITPFLLPQTFDDTGILFAYIALLVVGILAVLRLRPWPWLAPFAAVGTLVIYVAWIISCELSGPTPDMWTKMGLMLGFSAIFVAAACLSARPGKTQDSMFHPIAAIIILAGAMLMALLFLDEPRVLVLYSYLWLINVLAIALAYRQPKFAAVQPIAMLATFVLLGAWISHYLNAGNLQLALAVVLWIGATHVGYAVFSSRHPSSDAPAWLRGFGTVAALATLAMLSVFLFSDLHIHWSLWAAALLANALVFVAGKAAKSPLPFIGGGVLTFLLLMLWSALKLDAPEQLAPQLVVLMFFALLFWAVSQFFLKQGEAENEKTQLDFYRLGVFIMPTALIIQAMAKLDLANPTLPFAAAAVLTLLALATAVLRKSPGFAFAALCTALPVHSAWHMLCRNDSTDLDAIPWYLAAYAVFLVFPYLARMRCSKHPWITHAVAALGYFFLIYASVESLYSSKQLSWLPTAFAVPTLASLWFVVRRVELRENDARPAYSWLGGVALFFLTLCLGMLFDDQTLNVSWALEGAALCWLYQRVRHRGLPIVGVGLLVLTFLRAVVVPFMPFLSYVLNISLRSSPTPLFNLQSIAILTIAIAMLFAGHWLTKVISTPFLQKTAGFLRLLAGISLFFLLNLEIANHFTPSDEHFIEFSTRGGFAQDMAYTIGWGIFALLTLAIGIWKNSRFTRYAAISLLAVTLLKLFLHDLSTIESIYRISALIAVGIVAFLASFLYQRFSAKILPHEPSSKPDA